MKYRISVLMGIFNCADTLDEAIRSLEAQTYENWKLIMCDDGSSDDTYKVAKKYADRNPEKYQLIKNNTKQGLNATLNNCLKLADTEYVARMDGDDISLPSRLETEINFLDSNVEYALVSAPMIYFDETGDFRVGVGSGEPKLSSFAKASPFAHAPCMIRTKVLRDLGGYTVSKKMLRVEDWDLWIRLYQNGFKGYNLDVPLYKMRDDRAAIRRRNFQSRINESRVRAAAVKKLRLSPLLYVYSIRPILIALLPSRVYSFFHKRG